MKSSSKNKSKLFATCDVCKKVFDVNFKQKSLTPTVKVRYFKCPYCKKVYTVGYFNAKINKLIRDGASREDIQAAQDKLEEKYGRLING